LHKKSVNGREPARATRPPDAIEPATPGAPELGPDAIEPETPAGRAPEIGGVAGPEPTRYGDWEHGGRCTDF
jgi:hypothetical protein